MEALAPNRIRVEDYFTSNFNTLSPNFDHVSKKPKLSPSSAHQPPDSAAPHISAKSTISRFFRYPEVTAQLKRQVHAPCRQSRFRFSANSRNFSGKLDFGDSRSGSLLTKRYERAKESAFRCLRYVRKDEDAIEVDNEGVEVVEKVRVEYPPKDSDEEVEILDVSVRNEGEEKERTLKPSSSSRVTELDNLDLPSYKKLLAAVNKKDDMFKRLKFDIELYEKRLLHLQPQKKAGEVKEVQCLIQEPFVSLTEEEDAEVACALSNSNRHNVLVTHENSNIDITGKSLQCLKPGAWLNDEVINVYLGLLKERERQEPQKFLRCHFFNTFFYKSIFVPIHKEVHWCLAVINKKDEKFQYLDSLRGRDPCVMPILAKYFVDEVKDKSGKLIDVSSWEQEFVEDLPEQQNGFDCGMFMIKYVDFYSRDKGLCFSQEHMPYFRLRTAKEILRLKAE
ncbi:ubiquitin-like-specific protease ESD4 isoform X2 [Ipomoea triloba]|uniref:ubiquitin-like-specific protease ESD4 isoform X2 n=1 Tax=Ipomoea triloba TaxID=35885 RepID=UPI00125E6405|nr:ubiquitin-like-specific protease ESD4 isoform X2 [Ipomoea triloba]